MCHGCSSIPLEKLRILFWVFEASNLKLLSTHTQYWELRNIPKIFASKNQKKKRWCKNQSLWEEIPYDYGMLLCVFVKFLWFFIKDFIVNRKDFIGLTIFYMQTNTWKWEKYFLKNILLQNKMNASYINHLKKMLNNKLHHLTMFEFN